MAYSPQRIIGAPSGCAGSPLDPGVSIPHLDIEMSGRLGSDALTFCQICCCCCKNRNTPRKFLTGSPFKFHSTGDISVSNPNLLTECIRRINVAYHSSIPVFCSSIPVTIAGTILPLLGVIFVVVSVIISGSTEVSIVKDPFLWIGLILLVLALLFMALYCIFGAEYTIRKPFMAIHEMCQIINEEVKHENIRFDFLIFDGTRYFLAIRAPNTLYSKMYNIYILRITDYKQPPVAITIAPAVPFP